MPSPWQGLLQGFDRSDPRGSIASLLANRPQGGGGLFGGLSGLSGSPLTPSAPGNPLAGLGGGGLFGGGGLGGGGTPGDVDYTSQDSTGGLGDLGNLGAEGAQLPMPPPPPVGTPTPPTGVPANWTTSNTPPGTLIEGSPANTGNEPLLQPTMPSIPQVNMPLSDAQFAAASAMGNSPGVTITPGVTPFNAPFGAGNSQGTPGIENLPSYIMQGGNWTPNNAAGTAAGVPADFNAFSDYTLQDYNNMLGPGAATNPSLYGSTPIPR